MRPMLFAVLLAAASQGRAAVKEHALYEAVSLNGA